jgi:AcrR family transcriptional regulator
MEDKILKAAEELFMEKGFAGTTLAEIARKAECTNALLHYYYRSKELLFERVFEEKIGFIAGHILEIDSREVSFERKMAQIVGAHFDFLAANPLFVPFIAGELLANPERFAPVLEKHGHFPIDLYTRLDKELQAKVVVGRVRPVATLDLMVTVISLNVAPFLVLPSVKRLAGLTDEAVREWLAARRQENIETVLSRLRI